MCLMDLTLYFHFWTFECFLVIFNFRFAYLQVFSYLLCFIPVMTQMWFSCDWLHVYFVMIFHIMLQGFILWYYCWHMICSKLLYSRNFGETVVCLWDTSVICIYMYIFHKLWCASYHCFNCLTNYFNMKQNRP